MVMPSFARLADPRSAHSRPARTGAVCMSKEAPAAPDPRPTVEQADEEEEEQHDGAVK
jgi:hypothetical protein